MVSCRSWTLRICFAVRSCRSLIFIFHFVVVSCGSWTLMICFAVRCCRSSILIFHFTVVSCGSWTLRICFAVRSCRSWILIFHFAVVSCGSWTFEDLFCHEILQILDLEVSVCRRILWILDPIFWPRHKSASGLSHLGPRQDRSGEFMWAPYGVNMGRSLARHDYPIYDPVQYSNPATCPATFTRAQD